MSKMLQGLAVVALGAGCASNEAVDPCNAQAYRSFVGSNVSAISLPADVRHRIIAPDSIVTMDYLPTRLNIFHDDDGVVTKIECG